MKQVLAVVSKCPRLGRCKTRLARGIGEQRALEFTECCLKDILNKYVALDVERYVIFASGDPDDEEFFMGWMGNLRGKWNLFRMDAVGNLGDLLYGFMKNIGLDCSFCFVGMDSPQLPPELVTFPSTNAEIIPSEDGGYVSLSIPPSLSRNPFESVAWSTDDAFRSQIQAVLNTGVAVHVNTTKYLDIDDLEDLRRFRFVVDEKTKVVCPRVSNFVMELRD